MKEKYTLKIHYVYQFIGLTWWSSQHRSCLRCQRVGSTPGSGKIRWRRKWQPAPVFLSGKSHGQRNLVGYSPWGRKELDRTEHTHMIYYWHPQSACNTGDLDSIPGLGRSPGEGNGNPLQYSCLGNPMVRVAFSPWGSKESDTS